MFASLTHFQKKKEKKTAKKNKKESHITGGQGRAVKVFAKKILPEPINYFPLKKVRCGDFFCKTCLDLDSPMRWAVCAHLSLLAFLFFGYVLLLLKK